MYSLLLILAWLFLFSLQLHYYMQLAWFPFFLFDTDWMGREVFYGDPQGDPEKVKLYQQGVREGAFGLLLNSVRTQNYSLNFY